MLNMTHKLVSVKRDHLCGLRVCFKTTTVFIFFPFSLGYAVHGVFVFFIEQISIWLLQ